MQKKISHNKKELSLLKPVSNVDYNSKTILTNSHWEYVELWLKRQNTKEAKKALFYWQQGKHFFQASECLPTNSKPLTSYYCCLNAVKTLLCLNKINVEATSHGITQPRQANNHSNSLENAEVIFLGSGILYELSKYLGEEAIKKRYVIKDLLYNIPSIHRAFIITYSRSQELFIPIKNLNFIREDTNSEAWIQFDIDKKYSHKSSLKNMPKHYEIIESSLQNSNYLVRKLKRFKWDKSQNLKIRLNNLNKYHEKIRKDIHYIYGDTKLWYLKKSNPRNLKIINKNSLTLIFAVMHWMSELVRYNPSKFEAYMNSKQNWLLHEFIQNALIQFIDEISCEITHQEIMSRGSRK
ncbi:MAG: YaaC family protein [Cetobacterium sp.]|uniref:YaaC family protein n=1 Tax=Cetobacterium sp. TaxID=2071632 RepID=UPI002FCAAB17